MKKADSLARFAALYADKVFIPNPFERYTRMKTMGEAPRADLVADVTVLLHLEPLFSAGLFLIRNDVLCLCDDCLRKMEGIENEVKIRLERVMESLTQEYLHGVTIESFDQVEGTYFRIGGPEELVNHGKEYIWLVEDGRQVYRKYIRQGGTHKLSVEEAVESGLVQHYTNPIARDLFAQSVHHITNGTQSLADQPVYLRAAIAVNNPEQLQDSNALLSALSHALPTVNQVKLSSLLKLRNEEAESFLVYRDTLRKGLAEQGKISAKEAVRYFEDEVKPALNRVNLRVKNSRKMFGDSFAEDVLFGAGTLAIGRYFGLIPAGAWKLLASLEGFNFVKDFLKSVNNLEKPPQQIRDDSFYFLWRAGQLKT